MHFTRGLGVQLAVVLYYAPGYQNEIEPEDRGMIPGIKLVMPIALGCLGLWASTLQATRVPRKAPCCHVR